MVLEAIICLKSGRRLRLNLAHIGGAADVRAMLRRWVDEGDVISVATHDGALIDVRADDVASLQVVEREEAVVPKPHGSNRRLTAPPPPDPRRPHHRASGRVSER